MKPARKISFVALVAVVLCGCAGSPIALMSDPEKKTVSVNGVEFSVNRIAENVYTSYRPYRMAFQTWSNAIYAEKSSHIKAITEATGCPVIDAEFKGASLYATVKCR